MYLRIALVMFLMGAVNAETFAADCSKCHTCPGLTKASALPRPPAIATAPAPKAAPAEPVSFEDALRDQIESRPETIRSRRILNVLDMEPGARRTRILERMERHAITHLDIKGEPGKIDWQNIDWAALFDKLLKLLALILPLLL